MTESQTTASNGGQTPKLLVGFDYTAHSARALDQALRFVAAWPSTRLIVLWARGAHLERRSNEPLELAEERALARLRDTVQERIATLGKAGLWIPRVEAQVMVSELPPEEAIVEHAFLEGADMVMVGTGEKDALDRLILGSVSQAVLRKAPCSVVIVREKAPEPQFAPPRQDRNTSGLGRRHTYHYESRNEQPGVTMPLVFPMG